ncbi:Rieske (2Fe-2S) protein [bacterium]|nr:Rieske (2Fe-2S) protein [bacterium]
MPNDKKKAPEGTEESVSRRKFVALGITAIGAVYAGAIGYPIYRYLATPAIRAEEMGQVTSISLAESDMPEPGSVLMFKFGSHPAMLIHHKDGSIVSFDAICTHLGCTVQFQADQDRIYCACHGGIYDPNTGKNIAGPPPKPLTVFNVEVADGQINISRI